MNFKGVFAATIIGLMITTANAACPTFNPSNPDCTQYDPRVYQGRSEKVKPIPEPSSGQNKCAGGANMSPANCRVLGKQYNYDTCNCAD
jgi:hypothetical protein